MSEKTAGKNKGNAASVGVATFGKKPGKTSYSGKSGKLHGLNPKAGVVAGKSKANYGSHIPAAWQIHDAGPGVEFAVVAPTGLETKPLEPQLAAAIAAGLLVAPTGVETGPLERETELADRLVAEIADKSADVRELCETYALKREELGRLTGFSLRALAEWAGGKLPSQPARRRLQEVRRLLDALAQIVKPESIPNWLHQRNPAFDHLTPLQVIELGEIDRLWAMVHDLGSGQPE